jgi:hypothetical protein
MKPKIIPVVLLLVLTAGCSLQAPAADPQPTYTPYPTYTPFPPEAPPDTEFVLIWGPDQNGFDGPFDPDRACQRELGPDSRMADWIDLVLYDYEGGSLVDLGAGLGVALDDFIWISLASQVDYSDSDFYAVIYAPTSEVYYHGLDALPDWLESTFVLSHRSADPMLPWLPMLCILEEQFNKMP